MDKKFVPLISRILLGHIFLIAGIEKVFNIDGTQAYMASKGMPFTLLFLLAAIAFEAGGGLSLILGYKARWGALALVLFLIPTTLIFHTNFAEPMQQAMFMKNLAIMGGLLMIASYGPGKLSLDGRKGHPTKTQPA
ncbi:MAG: DoxX family protein [Candidatus Abyssobacteria bacterium SURF_5]|uniref:DoxX family protein n=1 Tax=Abyssobacteria bacterium (strain SURF_5) TaxID=2093360 RepID=A0A3A4P179_ABYX5|nr:MAG: DoxX family protein [Candidatus Abyssubacteria bacterium SURF_5]